MSMGDDERAYEEARRALDLARETGYRRVESHAPRILGQLHARRAEPERALHRHLRSEAIAREVSGPGLLAAALNSLAGARAVAGHPREALRGYAESIALAVGSDHRDLLAHAPAGIAEMYAGLGDRDSARAHWRQALTTARPWGCPRPNTYGSGWLSAARSRPPPERHRPTPPGRPPGCQPWRARSAAPTSPARPPSWAATTCACGR